MGKVRVFFANGRFEDYDRIICALPTAACANIDWEGFNKDSKFLPFLEAFRNLNAEPLFKHSV